MSPRSKHSLGIAACAPSLALPYLLLTVIISGILYALLSHPKAEVYTRYLLITAMVVLGISLLIGLGATLICNWHMRRNPDITGVLKFKWKIAGFFWPVTVPFYWYHHIWKQR
ncbi:hypothetical protein EON83_19565 [bacterium]|nr:MAG: hypothetical protein EON83_19565 [bacterium]